MANDDWKADMLAAWKAGELEYQAFGDPLAEFGAWLHSQRPEFSYPRECYRRRPKPAEVEPNNALIDLENVSYSDAQAALPQPQSDLPGIAKQQAWLAAQPAPVPPPAPTPKEHPGLATIAPMSGRVGGRWGL
jgi:hypothetical protein